MPANTTPQTMTVKGKNQTLKLENILIGDVWVLGGQSNMEFPISNVVDGQLEVVSANFPEIRLLTIPVGKGFKSVHSFERLYEWSSWSSRHFRKGDWDICTPETVAEFSAIGYVFGRRLAMATQVPIGLIDASQGGTTVEAWTPEAVLKKIDGKETREMLADWAQKIAEYDPKADLENQIKRYESRVKSFKDQGKPVPANLKRPTELRPGPVADKNRPGCRFASTIQPLEGLAVSGVLWHQGYNNCFNGSAGAKMYYQVFGPMITAWRKNFDDAKLPFCVISQCTAGAPQTMDNFLPPMFDVGALLRAAQYKTFVDFEKAGDTTIGFVSCYDQRKSSYHPGIKIPVGERAAKWALASKYELFGNRGAEEYWLPPTIEKIDVADGKIKLTMSTTVKTADESTDKLQGFAIAGEDRHFYPAVTDYYTDGKKDNRGRVQYAKNILVLSSPFVAKPTQFRYAWARNPMGNITNNRGVPLATQRTDDWLLEEVPVKIPAPQGMPESSVRRYVGNLCRQALNVDNMDWRIKQAKWTVKELTAPYEKARADWDKRMANEKKKAEEAAAKAAKTESGK